MCGLVFWPMVGGKDSLRHALWPAPWCLAFVGLPLAMVEAGGQMEASGAGGPFVYWWLWGPCFGLCVVC